MSENQTRPEVNLEKLYAEIEENAKRESHESAPSAAKSDDPVRRASKEQNELLRFFGGMLLFGAGMFMIFQNLIVESSWGLGSIFHIGGFGIPNGTIMVPLLIGIALLFLCDRKLWGWLFITIGIVIILAAVIMSISVRWRTSSGWMFFTMFALTMSGGAMMLRELFRGKD
ncbi:MAG TPA: hypothetical protein DDX71_00910 [Ruminococcus sp.]|nr:hypothetical protein [Ruminococcus sp.]